MAAAAANLKIEKLPYLIGSSSDFDKIWHSDAVSYPLDRSDR